MTEGAEAWQQGLGERIVLTMDPGGRLPCTGRRGIARLGALHSSPLDGRRRVLLPRLVRLWILVVFVLVLAPLVVEPRTGPAIVGSSALLHALLYLAPALVFLVPLCVNRDPAGELLVRLARRPRAPTRATEREKRSLHATIRYAVVWLPRGGLLIGMARAGRAPPPTPLPAVLPLGE